MSGDSTTDPRGGSEDVGLFLGSRAPPLQQDETLAGTLWQLGEVQVRARVVSAGHLLELIFHQSTAAAAILTAGGANGDHLHPLAGRAQESLDYAAGTMDLHLTVRREEWSHRTAQPMSMFLLSPGVVYHRFPIPEGGSTGPLVALACDPKERIVQAMHTFPMEKTVLWSRLQVSLSR